LKLDGTSYHTPVLLQETLAFLLTARNGFYVEGTLGGGGHAEAVLKELAPEGMLIGIDLDDDALAAAGKRLKDDTNRIRLVKSNFRNIRSVLSQCNVGNVHGILLDLGVSSFQLDAPEKGFSFRADEILDMRMDRTQHLNARQIVNTYDERSLAELFWKYGEEKDSRKIARTLIRTRTMKPITTTGELASIIERIVGGRFLNKTLARVFQAIRIEVNNELENLQKALSECIDVLMPGGRLIVISYHSLEDRIVKEVFRDASATSKPSGHKLLPDDEITPAIKVLTRKPVMASDVEVAVNSRARSAKLRAAERV
jgi:16S rRNA (cytosine1402-N4)-methyltransferase